MSMLTVVLLLSTASALGRAEAKATSPEEAVRLYLAAVQSGDGKAAIALWPDAIRKAGATLIPLGEATRKARADLEAALLEKFGGKKEDHRLDPADLLPVLD